MEYEYVCRYLIIWRCVWEWFHAIHHNYDGASRVETMPCNKIDKPLVVYTDLRDTLWRLYM